MNARSNSGTKESCATNRNAAAVRIAAVAVLTQASTALGQAGGGGEGCPWIFPGSTFASGWAVPIDPPQDLVPDYRPVSIINAWNGSYYKSCSSKDYVSVEGLVPGWNDLNDQDTRRKYCSEDPDAQYVPGIIDGVDWLLLALDAKYARGFRRFCIKLPGGRFDNTNMPSAQYWTIPQLKRDDVDFYVSQWIALHDDPQDPVDVMVYMGFEIQECCSLAFDNPRNPDWNVHDDMVQFGHNVKPWYDNGIITFMLDAAGGNENGPDGPNAAARQALYQALTINPSYPAARFGHEMAHFVPDTGGSGLMLGESSLWGPSMSLYIDYRNRTNATTFQDDPQTWPAKWDMRGRPVETGIGLRFADIDLTDPSADKANLDRMYEFVLRGHVLWSYVSDGDRMIERLYPGFALPADICDFDLDNDVDNNDILRFYSFVTGGPPDPLPWGYTWYHGDLDQDGDVDWDDYSIFYYDHWYPCSQ